MRFCTMPASPGEMVSALMVAPMIRSSSSGFTPLSSRAARAAATPMSVLVSVVHTRRSFTPTRLVIHSSEVSTMWERSSLVSTFRGRKLPVPKMRKLISVLSCAPGFSAVFPPAGPAWAGRWDKKLLTILF